MTRRLTVLMGALALAACGQGDSAPAQGEAAAPPPAPSPASAPAAAPTDAEAVAVLASLPAPYNAADLQNGERVFARCRSCHTINEGGPNRVGPNLWQVFGRTAGTHGTYNYSPALREAGFTWDAAKLDEWLNNPREFLPGNKMSFAGVRDADDRRDLIAWLKVNTGYAPEA